MKNINPFTLPHFHGLVYEYHDTFLFEFAVICRTYDYTIDYAMIIHLKRKNF
jgi:hypothetical protein